MPGSIPRLLVTFPTQRLSVKEDDSDYLGNVQTRAHRGRHPEYGVHASVSNGDDVPDGAMTDGRTWGAYMV